MTDLFQLQESFQHFLLTGLPEINTSIVSSEKVSVDTRLNIYKQAYQLRLVDCLSANFPGLHNYLGDEEFSKLGKAYLQAHPSTFRSVRWFGDCLADFIKTNYDERFAYLVELVDFEWKMTLAFDEADDLVLRVEDMVAIKPESWPGLHFQLHASVQRAHYLWNVPEVWQALIHLPDIPEWNSNEKGSPWIIWRSPDYIVQYYNLSETEAWAIDAISQGLTFAEICEGLCQWLEEEVVGMTAASYLKGWIQKGILRIAPS